MVSFALVGSSSGTSPLLAVTRADALLVAVAEHSRATVSTVSDSLGNSYRQLGASGYYLDSNGPERVTLFGGFNATRGGTDTLSVTLSSYAWAVVFFVDLRGVGSQPLDHQASFTNSSQSGQSTATITDSVYARPGDLVLMVGGIRGNATETASGSDTLLATNLSAATYNAERAALLDRAATANGTISLDASNSNTYAPWVADVLSISPGRAWCSPQCAVAQVSISAHTSFSFYAASGKSSRFAVPRGSVVLAFLNIRGTSTPSSVADAYGDTFQEVSYATIGGCCRNGLGLYEATDIATNRSADSLSVAMPGVSPVVVNVLVLGGVNTSQPFAARSAYTSANYSSAVSSTVSSAPDMVLLAVAEWGQYAISADNETVINETTLIVPWQNETGGVFGFNATSPNSSLTLDATLISPNAWIAMSVALEPGDGSVALGPPPPHPPVISAHRSFAIVGAASGTSPGFDVQLGDAIVVVVGERGSAVVLAVNDTLGNTFSQLGTSGVYSDHLGPERVTLFGAFNASYAGTDNVSVRTASYAWTAIVIAVVHGVAASPLDAVANVTNSSQAGQSTSVVQNTVAANPGDLVLLGGGIRGIAGVNATGREYLVDENLSYATYTSQRTALVALNWSAAAGNATVRADSSNSGAPWVAGAIALRPATPSVEHVVVIFLENQARYQVLQGGPYERYLASTYADATNFWAVCHGSTAAYLAATSGASDQCGSSALNNYSTTQIGDLVEQRGLTWGDYQESMPSSCYTGISGLYVNYHNPFVYYSDVTNSSTRCTAHVVNSQQFNSSFASGTLRNYSFYTPNLIDDCHNSSLSKCDGWLKGFLAPMLNATKPAQKALLAHTVFFVLYDESSSNDSGGYNGTTGGHVYFVAVSPWSRGIRFTSDATQYNLLSTVEWLLGLGRCGNHDGTSAYPAMQGLFQFG